jgi:hypothetical protein
LLLALPFAFAFAPTTGRAGSPGPSTARQWNDVLLEAIRKDLARPTVHARNLYHVSVAMWDAWAAYDAVADGVLVTEKIEKRDPREARRRAISYAAYRLLSHRYGNAVGAEESLGQFDELMASLCYRTDQTRTKGDSAAALGNRIAQQIIAHGIADGSREQDGYAPVDYVAVN